MNFIQQIKEFNNVTLPVFKTNEEVIKFFQGLTFKFDLLTDYEAYYKTVELYSINGTYQHLTISFNYHNLVGTSLYGYDSFENNLSTFSINSIKIDSEQTEYFINKVLKQKKVF